MRDSEPPSSTSQPPSSRLDSEAPESAPIYFVAPHDQVQLRLESGVNLPVQQFGANGFTVPGPHMAPFVPGEVITAWLDARRRRVGPLQLRVDSGMTSARMLRPVHLTPGLRRELNRLVHEFHTAAVDALLVWEETTDSHFQRDAVLEAIPPERYPALMHALVAAGRRGKVRDTDVEVHALRIEHLQGQLCVVWRASADLQVAPWVIELPGYNSIFFLYIDDSWPEGMDYATPLPSSIERVRRRFYRRVDLTEEVWITYVNPNFPQAPLRPRRLRDMSYAGLCFETPSADDVAFVGQTVPLIEIHPPQGEPIRLVGQVRTMRQPVKPGPFLCGMKVEPASKEDQLRWLQLASRQLHATTETGPEWAESLWELFVESGYFRLSGKKPEDFEPLKLKFFALSRTVADGPNMMCQAVWPSPERGVEATVALVKVYQRAWLGHQLAKRTGSGPPKHEPRQILRDIYLRAFEHPQADPDFRWVIGYIEADVPWMYRAHVQFAQRHEARGHALVLRFQLLEISCSVVISTNGWSGTVGDPTPREQVAVLQYLESSLPPAFVKAFDLRLSGWDFAKVRKMWGDLGLERDRTMIVAREGGEVVAVAVTEIAEEGLNLFRLLDSVRLFPVKKGGERAFNALLEETRQRYVELGRPAFTYFCHGDGASLPQGGWRDLGAGYLWIISAMLVPEFLEHIYELTVPRRLPGPA